MGGYPEDHGKELATFLSGIRRISGKGPAGAANGIQCLAAQAVAHFKTEPGGFYLVPFGQEEEWNYVVAENSNGDWTLRVMDCTGDKDIDYFFGTPQEFLEMLEKDND
jgi:hypothetical protein